MKYLWGLMLKIKMKIIKSFKLLTKKLVCMSEHTHKPIDRLASNFLIGELGRTTGTFLA